MVVRSILASIIVFFTFLSANAQKATDPAVIAAANAAAGTYRIRTTCLECDSTVTTLKLESDGKSDGGTFTIKKTNTYDDGRKKVIYKREGEWYLLENKAKDDNTTIVVLHIDYVDELETYPCYMVMKNGNLLELNQQGTERVPQYIFRDTAKHGLYVAKKGGPALPLNKALHYKDADRGYIDPTIDHILIRK